jgi:hypothetical protein
MRQWINAEVMQFVEAMGNCRDNAKFWLRQWENAEIMQRVSMRQWENAEVMQNFC